MLSICNVRLKNKDYFSLTIFPYTSLAIRGKNGSGKTTLLKKIATLSLNKKASVSYDGTDNSDHICSNFAFLSHELGLFEHLTALDHLLFWVRLYGTELMLQSAIRTLEIEEHLEKPVKHLSLGNKKRLALAGIMLQNKKVWILDEPFANLDKNGFEILQNMLDARTSSGGIIIFTTHYNNTKSHIEVSL